MAKTMDKDAKGQEAAEIEFCKAALLPFSRISPQGDRRAVFVGADGAEKKPEFTGNYRINRSRRQVTIAGADIEAAAACVTGSPTLDECRKAIKPFAKLPVDLRVEDPKAAIYAFPAVDGGEVAITNAMIETAQELAAG